MQLKNVTEEQIEGICMFINMNEWANIEIERHPGQVTATENVEDQTLDNPMPSNSINEEVLFCDVHQDITSDSCPYCFLQPCVITHRQSWLIGRKESHTGNRAIRRRMYKKFWSTLYHRDAWKHPLYLMKKQEDLIACFPETVWETGSGHHTDREIMPDCLLNLVRDLYPNLPGQPYTGHKWQ
jgi:hypothetical protein